jgi:hypothetical protein
MLILPFYSSGGWESDCSLRVTDDGGANSILRFQLEMGGDRTKHYRKMKRMHQAHLSSMGRKCDTTQRRSDVGRRRGDIEKEKGRR